MLFQRDNIVSLIYKNLKKGDYVVKPFKTHKTWDIASDHSENFVGISTFYETSGIKIYRVLYPEDDRYFGNVANISSSIYDRPFTTQSVDPKLIWYQLNHTYYDYFEYKRTPLKAYPSDVKTHLYESSSVIIIPQKVFGEQIKPGSIRIEHYGSENPFNYNLIDDFQGNIIDTGYDKTKLIDPNTCVLNLGFNEQYRSYNFRNKRTVGPIDYSNYNNQIIYINPKKISYTAGIPTTSPVSSSGTAAVLEGGYFRVANKENFEFIPKSDFAISFWINLPTSQSNYDYTYNNILNKSKVEFIQYFTVNSLTQQRIYAADYVERPADRYPFDIKVNNSSDQSSDKFKLTFSRSSGLQTLNLTSNSQLSTGSWTHVVCQKSGSLYSIYLNGTLDASQSFNIRDTTFNNHEMYIGGEGTSRGMLSGSLDEFRIYNTALSQTQITALSDNSYDLGYAYQTNIVGNAFYSDGIIVISDPRPKYKNSMLGRTGNYDYNGRTDGFLGSFKSTATFYEHEIVCKIRKNEFNSSQNPTAIEGEDGRVGNFKDFVTSSFFNPYFTTIGLYNSQYELVAVAKMASPLEKRDDVDMNVIIRFDM